MAKNKYVFLTIHEFNTMACTAIHEGCVKTIREEKRNAGLSNFNEGVFYTSLPYATDNMN